MKKITCKIDPYGNCKKSWFWIYFFTHMCTRMESVLCMPKKTCICVLISLVLFYFAKGNRQLVRCQWSWSRWSHCIVCRIFVRLFRFRWIVIDGVFCRGTCADVVQVFPMHFQPHFAKKTLNNYYSFILIANIFALLFLY